MMHHTYSSVLIQRKSEFITFHRLHFHIILFCIPVKVKQNEKKSKRKITEYWQRGHGNHMNKVIIKL